MAKSKLIYACQQCGAVSHRWSGRCDACGEWNTLLEEASEESGKHIRMPLKKDASPIPITDDCQPIPTRLCTNMLECDRVLGGGIVPGSITLIGGDPGIGKSTLMLQVSQYLADSKGPVLYVSGEESFSQTRLRANRLASLSDNLYILTETNVSQIRKHISAGKYCLVIIDSIQSVYTSDLPAIPGSVSQVRECATEFLRISKGQNIPIFLVGHVTKDGVIAGPRLLEHLVDTVLYFEGEGKQSLRILRAVKNRFGSTNEIGVFEMTGAGLNEVTNPSALFLDERPEGVSGSVVIPSVEGSRPLLVEVQALVGETHSGSPRRTVTGMNPNRISLLLAVLEKRAGYHFSDKDVFVNVAGGIRLEEPAVDIAAALALVSSLLDVALPADLSAFGEVGLAGEIRAVNQPRQRVSEASKFGFKKCIVPEGCEVDARVEGATLLPVENVLQAIDIALEKRNG